MLDKPLVLIVDEEITLKQFSVEDVDEIFYLIDRNRAHLSQYDDITAEKYPTKNSVLESIINPANSLRLRFGILANSVYVGSINLTLGKEKEAEVGYYLGKEFEGKGFISRSLKRIIKYGFEELLCNTIWAGTHLDNKKSQKVLESCGFARYDDDSGKMCYRIQSIPTIK
jgi:RimJ/RimL family protein N-acetyltransferase